MAKWDPGATASYGHIQGWDKLVEALNSFPEKIAREKLKGAFFEAAKVVAEVAKARAPVGTEEYSYKEKVSGKVVRVRPGLLRRRIKAYRGKANYKGFRRGLVAGAAVMVRGLKYAKAIEYGHIFLRGKDVTHYPAKKMMRSALESTRGQVEKIIEAAVQSAVDELNKGTP